MKSYYSLPKRPTSRYSTCTFSNVDFNYIGNTNNVNHLIKRRIGGIVPHPIELNYELNLRNYKSQSNFKGVEPWVYPKNKKFKAVVTDKSFFPKLVPFYKKG